MCDCSYKKYHKLNKKRKNTYMRNMSFTNRTARWDNCMCRHITFALIKTTSNGTVLTRRLFIVFKRSAFQLWIFMSRNIKFWLLLITKLRLVIPISRHVYTSWKIVVGICRGFTWIGTIILRRISHSFLTLTSQITSYTRISRLNLIFFKLVFLHNLL